MCALRIMLLILFLNASIIFSDQSIEEKNLKSKFDKIKSLAPGIFIDCTYCDLEFIKAKIIYINYVRDPDLADIYILITWQNTGSGGREYTIKFEGQRAFKDMDYKLIYVSKQEDTDSIRRDGIIRNLKIGLIKYLFDSPLLEYLDITFSDVVTDNEVKDEWDSWIFDINLRGYSSGYQSYSYFWLTINMNGNRVTEESRIKLSTSMSYDESNYKIDEDTYRSISRRHSAYGTYVLSLTDHWSAGMTASYLSSTYSNIKSSYELAPAIEYNLFPYSESTSKQLRFQYKLAYQNQDYIETTVYDKNSETLFYENLSINLGLIQKWGSIDLSLDAKHYFHDFSKNNLGLYCDIEWRILRGLSFTLSGSYYLVHDQISLPKGDATTEEILLQLKELKTNYSYWISFGIRFTFGSTYNNVVNPRFGY